MPIIVDEVVISVEVATPPAGGQAPASAPAPQDKQALVAECVERVLDILRQRKER
jgi:hypothetical protein